MACRSCSRGLLVASLLILCALRISAETINSEQRASAPDSATASQHEQRKTKSSQSVSSSSSRSSSRSASSRDNVASYLVSWAEHLITMKGDHYTALKHFRLAGALGHAGALTSAASMQLSGENQIPRDISAAVRLLRLAVAKGQPDAQAILALLHATGIADRYGVEKNVPLAILYWTFAANAGNVFANAALGFRYMFGIDVRRNCAAAAKYYKVAAKSVAVNPRSFPSPDNFIRGPFPLTSRLRPQERVRMTEEIADRTAGLPGDDVDVLHYYRHSAAHGDNDAAATLGALHLFGGHGLEPNEARAVEALNRAAVNGHGDAHGMLGHLAMRKRKNETALAHLKKSSKVGNRIGHYALGMIYLHGLLGEQVDLEKAAEHFRQASEAQHAGAFLQLGLMHWKGLGVLKSPPEAYRLFQQGARLDNVQCKFYLGHITLKGLSPVNKPDCERALPYFKSVAEQGEWKLVFNAAADAFGSHDDFGALYRYLQAAHAGVELGQYNAALLLERRAAGNISEIAHWDRPRLISAAAELYELSAKQGSSEALVRAGNMAYEETRDYRSAFSAFMRGADLLNPEAQFSVGWMYVRGLGVPQDRHLAIRYLENARTMSPDAAVPVNVALALLRIYWWAADTARSVGADKFLLAQFHRMRAAFPAVYDDSRSLMTSHFWLGTLQQLPSDIVLIILLLCALLVVLLLRKRRLASAMPPAGDPHET